MPKNNLIQCPSCGAKIDTVKGTATYARKTLKTQESFTREIDRLRERVDQLETENKALKEKPPVAPAPDDQQEESDSIFGWIGRIWN